MESDVVIDTSAIVAIVTGEDHADDLLRMLGTSRRLVGSPTLLEAAMVLIGRKQLQIEDLTSFLSRIQATIVNFDHHHAEIAIQAFERYGRGRHPAGLNYGDCMSYAVAKKANAPLLFVGNDFSQTDIQVPNHDGF